MNQEYAAPALFVLSILLSRKCTSCSDTVDKQGNKKHKPAVQTDDNCHSLFYSDEIMSDGRGFPKNKSVKEEEVTRLKTVHPEYIKLSKELYGGIVANIPTVCVDVICQREVDNKVLLFYRRDRPAKGLWWLPGGRMLKGETFFDTALRKIKVSKLTHTACL